MEPRELLPNTSPIADQQGLKWVDGQLAAERFMPERVRTDYRALVERVVAANPGMSPRMAYETIRTLEKQEDHRFFQVVYSEDPGPRLVTERQRLTQLEALNLLPEEEQTELERLRAQFRAAVEAVVTATGEEPTSAAAYLDSALIYRVAESLPEAESILVNGPKVEGFEVTTDPKMSDAAVLRFLQDTFTPKHLRQARVGQVVKDDRYLIYRNPQKREQLEQGNELAGAGLVQWHSNLLLARSREDYLRAEMVLEDVTEPGQLRHLYKIRASVATSAGFQRITLRSFGVERPDDYEYLSDIGLEHEDDQQRAYILGTLVHEIAHRYQDRLSDQAVTSLYRQLVDEEVMPSRTRYVSDYVVRHATVYGSDEQLLLREDFAESVRIYATNPDYLQAHYPRRFALLASEFPFIAPGTVVPAIRAMQPVR